MLTFPRVLHHDRQPDVGPLIDRRAEELGRCHADDADERAIDAECAANDVAGASELPRPEAVADHRDRVRIARAIVGGRQQAADLRLLPKRGKAFTGDELDPRHLAN
jgi:hypothetical protein